MTRDQELMEEAQNFETVARFLLEMAAAKRRIAEQISKIDAAGSAGGGSAFPPRLASTRDGGAA